MRGRNILRALEETTERQVPDWIRTQLAKGASEIDLVHSGLDDSMRTALQEIIETRHRNSAIEDYRTAGLYHRPEQAGPLLSRPGGFLRLAFKLRRATCGQD